MKQLAYEVELEQMILSGVNNNPQFTPIVDAELLIQIQKRFETKPSARLLCILVVCYAIADKDFKKLLDSLKSGKETVQRIKDLANNSTSKFKRVTPVMSEEQKQDYKQKLQQYPGIDQLRIRPKLVDLAFQSLSNQLSSADFPYIGGEPLGATRNAKNAKAMLLRAKDPNAGKLILFVVGGVTRAEIYGLQMLEKELSHEQIIVGSTGVHTGDQMMRLYSGTEDQI